MFDDRYGAQVTQARDELLRVAGGAARQVAAVLRDHPVRGAGPYPLAEVRAELVEQLAVLTTAVEDFPLAVAVDTDGRVDRVGAVVTALVTDLTRVTVFYRNLTDLPDVLRSQALREFEALLSTAHGVAALAGHRP